MKSPLCLLLVLLAAAPLLAKPKVAVHVTVNQGKGRDEVQDTLSKNGVSNSAADTVFATVYFLNVTVTSDKAEALAGNDGHWCIKGASPLDVNGEYPALLNGNGLDVQVPAKNGKTKTLHFEVLDHKWRTLADL